MYFFFFLVFAENNTYGEKSIKKWLFNHHAIIGVERKNRNKYEIQKEITSLPF